MILDRFINQLFIQSHIFDTEVPAFIDLFLLSILF